MGFETARHLASLGMHVILGRPLSDRVPRPDGSGEEEPLRLNLQVYGIFKKRKKKKEFESKMNHVRTFSA